VHTGRTDLSDDDRWVAENTNPEGRTGDVHSVLQGADAFVGLSVPELLDGDDIARMGSDPVVFALANPTPELTAAEAEGRARVYATGRPDVANQVNSELASPGIWRGALDCRATTINEAMTLAAAKAIAETAVQEHGLSEVNVVPSFFNPQLVTNVAAAVRAEAERSGVARVTAAGAGA
jgi:malate dehydrogenase (oxaloacetate-decarboxylating)